MDQDFTFRDGEASGRRQTRTRVVLAAAVAAFLLGALTMFYVARNVELPGGGTLFRVRDDAAEETPPEPAPQENQAPRAEPAITRTAAVQAAERVERVAEQQGGLDQRVAAMEQRIVRLDLQARAAVGNAARAEGLLIAFATRRAIERGAPLGYLADQLRLRFGDARPNSVETVIDFARDPVTLDQLLARLDRLAPRLAQSPPDESFVNRVSREFSRIFVIRRESDPSPAAERRLDRARLFLESGRTDAAVAEVRLLPNAGEAATWISDARRYASVQRALELLETTAIMEPRELRDGAGNAVVQPSPAGANGQP